MRYRIHKCFGVQCFTSGTHLTLTSANALRNICTGLFYLTGQSRADRALPALGYVPLTCFLFPFYKATALLEATLRDSSPAPLCLFKHGKETLPMLLPVTELQCLERVLGCVLKMVVWGSWQEFPICKEPSRALRDRVAGRLLGSDLPLCF